MDRLEDARVAVRRLLVKLYAQTAERTRVLDDAGVNHHRIDRSDNPEQHWHAILIELEKQASQACQRVRDVTIRDYAGNAELKNLWRDYLLAMDPSMPPQVDADLRRHLDAMNITLPAQLDPECFYHWDRSGRASALDTLVDREYRAPGLSAIARLRNIALIVISRTKVAHPGTNDETVMRQLLFKRHPRWLDVIPSIEPERALPCGAPLPVRTASQWQAEVEDARNRRELLAPRSYHSPRLIGGLLTFKNSPTNNEVGCYRYLLFAAEADFEGGGDRYGKFHFLTKHEVDHLRARPEYYADPVSLPPEADPTAASSGINESAGKAHGGVSEQHSRSGADRSGRPFSRYMDPNGDVFRALEALNTGWRKDWRTL